MFTGERPSDPESSTSDDDDGGMDAAAYAVIACGCLAFGLLIAAFLWWAHGRGL